MIYRVVLTPTVREAINAQIAYFRSEAVPSATIASWLSGLLDPVDGLYQMPHRFPVAELVSATAGFEIRRLNYAEHALYFRVIPDRKVVEILAFRHGRQKPWKNG